MFIQAPTNRTTKQQTRNTSRRHRRHRRALSYRLSKFLKNNVGLKLIELNKLFVILAISSFILYKLMSMPVESLDTTLSDIKQYNWAHILVLLTCMGFSLDLFFTKETKQGSPILLIPTLLYVILLVFAAPQKNIFGSNISEETDSSFYEPEYYFYPIDAAVAYVMMKDFYARISSRHQFFRLVMAALVIATCKLHCFVTLPIYVFLRYTLFMAPKIQKSRAFISNKRNNNAGLVDSVLDEGDTTKTTWMQKLPSTLAGITKFTALLGIYIFYVICICFPASVALFILRRFWMLRRRTQIQGPIYGIVEPVVPGKFFPTKSVVAVTGHFRLLCCKNKQNLWFNMFLGWWIRPLLDAFVLFEFTLPFQNNYEPYCSFLMEEFGTVFPFGDGLGFGSHKDVEHILSNQSRCKTTVSSTWSIVTSPPLADSNDTALVKDDDQQLVYALLEGLSDKLKIDIVRKRLDAILPFANGDGTPVDQALIETSFGSTVFHLLTDGELTEMERQDYHKLIKNANRRLFPSILEYIGIDQDVDLIQQAFSRYLEEPSLQMALVLVQEKELDSRSRQDIVNLLAYIFSIVAGATPAFLLSTIVNTLFADPSLVPIYKQNKRKFILEMARLKQCTPLINFSAQNFALSNDGENHVTIFNQRIPVPDGTPLHCFIQNANRDVSVFGADANELNFNRSNDILKDVLSFDGSKNDIVYEKQNNGYTKPVVCSCPGYGYTLDVLEFLVDRFCPPQNEVISKDASKRLKEIASNESLFMKFVLTSGQKTYSANNRYFPCASDVIHPLDTNGRPLGSLTITAAGGRILPTYDEDVPTKDMIKDSLTGLVLKYAPISDDPGEWESPAEAIAWRMKWFKSNFPPANIDYTSKYSSMSKIMSELAFGGFCCLHTHKISSYLKDSFICKHAPNEAVYVNDNTQLGEYKVRSGYERYGAAAYFDQNCNLIGVYTCCEDKFFARPDKLDPTLDENINDVVDDGDDDDLEKEAYTEWRHAMWVWRVSAMAFVTVVDHLVNVHMINSNTLVKASRTHLPIDHPLRPFFKIFTYRTIGINSKAYKTLISRKGIVNRNWAFETDDLQKLISATPCTFKKKFTDYIPYCMRDDDPNYPANQDLKNYYTIVRKMVNDVFRTIYDAPGTGKVHQLRMQHNVDSDYSLQAFLWELADGLNIYKAQDLSSLDDIIEVVTSLICSVTGMHELIGQISDYFVHPKICGTTLRQGKEVDSIQIYQLNCTLVSSTGLRMPRLLGNWEHLLNRNEYGDTLVRIMRRFQDDLRELSLKIDNLNQDRRFKMEAFNPANLECSVSV